MMDFEIIHQVKAKLYVTFVCVLFNAEIIVVPWVGKDLYFVEIYREDEDYDIQ